MDKHSKYLIISREEAIKTVKDNTRLTNRLSCNKLLQGKQQTHGIPSCTPYGLSLRLPHESITF